MEKGLLNYGNSEYEGVTRTWDIVQHEVGKYLINIAYRIYRYDIMIF